MTSTAPAGMLRLRDYQTEAIDAVLGSISDGMQRPAVVLPTGAGKTVIFSHLAHEWNVRTGTRPLVLVHRDELVRQTEAKLRAVAPGLAVGVVQASRDEHWNADALVGSVQTLRMERRRREIQNVGLVIVDEAHHAAAESYRTVMDHFGCYSGGIPAVGFSATLTRDDSKSLAAVWDDVVYQRDILDMIRDGYLVDPVGKLVTVDGLSLGEIKTTRGDFAESSLTDALLTADAQRFVVRAFMEHARDRKTIVFTPTVEAAHAFAAEFRAAGVSVGTVWGAMPLDERRRALDDFAAGRIQVLCNCMVLTEGFDEPSASCAIIARPTRSASLYVQMVGRVLRLFPGKENALILDVVGASRDHRLATLADLSSRRIDDVMPGESLTEAVERERKRGNPKLADYVMNTTDVDLFHRSSSAWLQTKKGIYFLSTRCEYAETCELFPGSGRGRYAANCGTHLWFLWPDGPGRYRLGVRPAKKAGGKWLRDGLDLPTAMAWAEQCATEEDRTLADRRASWRRRNDKPSEAQIDYATSLGIVNASKLSKRDLSDAISISIASGCIDPALG